jgi:hypothetical protein
VALRDGRLAGPPNWAAPAIESASRAAAEVQELVRPAEPWLGRLVEPLDRESAVAEAALMQAMAVEDRKEFGRGAAAEAQVSQARRRFEWADAGAHLRRSIRGVVRAPACCAIHLAQ